MLTPEIDDTLVEVVQTTAPSYGYRLDAEADRARGTVDDLAAVSQAVEMILATEQQEHPIYDAGYGLKTIDLIGKPHSYAANELRRRITESLLQDDRITAVHSFQSRENGDVLSLSFTVDTIFGEIRAGKGLRL